MAKTKYYIPDDYGLGQKVGAANKPLVRNLFDEVYGNKADHDFNTMLTGMISVIERNGLIGQVKEEVVVVPEAKQLELEEIEMAALKTRMAERKKKIASMRSGK